MQVSEFWKLSKLLTSYNKSTSRRLKKNRLLLSFVKVKIIKILSGNLKDICLKNKYSTISSENILKKFLIFIA